MYAAMAWIISFALPWWIGKGDSALHLDYVRNVYHGEIPRYHQFVEYEPFHRLDPKYITQINRAGANPPFFYLIHAPIVAPIMDTGNWKLAVAAGRSVNIVLGAMAMLALAWAGWVYGGKRKELFAVAVPAVAGASFQVTSLNQNYAVDVLLILLGVLTSIVWYKMLTEGLKTNLVVPLFILSILGMSTKATYIVYLGISIVVLMATAFLKGKSLNAKRLMRRGLLVGLLLVCVAISIGWFYYYWNYKTSGKWFTGELPGDFGSRTYKSLPTVLTSRGLWANYYQNLTTSPTLSITITAVSSIGVLLAASKVKWSHVWKNISDSFPLLTLLMLIGGTTLTQIGHAWGIGKFGFRYFLPAILAYALFVTFGMLHFKRANGLILGATIIAMVGSSLHTAANLENIKDWVPAVASSSSIPNKLQIAMAYNQLPAFTPYVLLLLLAAATATTVWSLFVLSRQANQ